MEQNNSKGLWIRLLDELYTYITFLVTISLLPVLAISFVVVRISKNIWIKYLSSRYPHLEFIKTDTIRSLLDTHRNQGIINVLLCVKGQLNAEEIKQNLSDHVVEQRDHNGDYTFPRLRQQLVSCWGNYAWDQKIPFRIENHFIVSNSVYKGRPVSQNNIQDCVSEIVSKYFPVDQSPWQYIVISFASAEPKYYILVRVHHLLLSGKKSLNIGDLLLVEQKKTEIITNEQVYQSSPLHKLLPTPSALPELWEKISEMFSNAWNEFVFEYDPVESPRALKTLPGMFHLGGLVLMSAVSAFREITKRGYNGRHTKGKFTAKDFIVTLTRECKRRNITLPKVAISPLVTMDPRKWPKIAIGNTFSTLRAIIKLPISISNEISALRELRKTGHVNHPNTFTWKYAGLAQLTVRATAEAWRGVTEAYRSPFKLWTDTIRSDDGQRHVLQTVSLCGRKVVAWSNPVSRADVERAAHALGVSCTDISLYAATEALRAYFDLTHSPVPEIVLTTARAATEDFLFTFSEGRGKSYKKSQTGGMVCLSLPIGATPRRIASVVDTACSRQRALAAAWTAQARYGALTRAVPSPFARLTLNLLSRRYAVTYTEINAPPSTKERTMLWGQALEHLVYWRPPQANISMSLTIMQYTDTVRLAVMTDSRLVPSHTIPAKRWPTAIEQLVVRIDQQIARISAQTIPRIIESVDQDTSVEEENLREESSTGTLKPPSTEVVSPPPVRKVVSSS